MKTVAMIRNSKKGDFGGAEKYPILTGEILKNEGFEVLIMSSNTTTLNAARDKKLRVVRSPWWSFQNYSGFKIILLPAYLVWQIFLIFWYLLVFKKYSVDIIYPQSKDDFISASLAGLLLHKKVIWTDHADLKHIYMNNKVWYKNPIGKIIFRISGRISSVTLESHSEKRLIEKSLGMPVPDNYKVIHIGVVDSYNPLQEQVNKDSGIVLVSTTRLVKDKGIGELIKAFSKIDDLNISLKICGEGPDLEKFQKMAYGIKNIEFLGFVKDIDAVLRQADILVHPTYHEGFGLSLVEAEMFQLPIIASNVGSIPEIVTDGVSGILIPPKDVDSLEKAIRTLAANHKMRTSMGKEGRVLFLKNFQFDKIVREKLIPLM